MAGSHLQNPSNPNPTKATKKSGQILKKQARSGEISTKSGYIWWDLARSGQTQQFLAKKDADFRKNPISGENFTDSGKNFQFPVKVPNSGYTFVFFKISMPFLIPATDPTRPTLTITKNRTDQFFRRLVSGYSAPPPDAGGSSPVGSKTDLARLVDSTTHHGVDVAL